MFRRWIQAWGESRDRAGRSEAGTVQARVDDSSGWASASGKSHDYEWPQVQELYQDALVAWRKNPIAWRIVAITTDYLVGDQLRLDSPVKDLDIFIRQFWNHSENHMDLRLEGLSDELARSGDLFIVLFRNAQDGMSYLRLVTKDRITKIVTAENDWEKELEYHEALDAGGRVKVWLSPNHPEAAEAEGIMLHYAVNRPVGALLGESDLTTMLPWLQRYSRMLEDRVQLHWAVRSFLWFVTVPTNMVKAKQEQYRTQPESGNIVVKDEAEAWEAVAPDLKGLDAKYDLQAVRGMIDAGSGYPPHWRGEAGDANLATATAMQGPTERHLLRRQQYFGYMLQDILFQAYRRKAALGLANPLPFEDYARLFKLITPDVSRWDNESTARAAREMATAMQILNPQMPGRSESLAKLGVKLTMKAAASPQAEEDIEAMYAEALAHPWEE